MARRAFDHIAQFVSSAVTDIREKLVEEAWFGRTTAPQERMSAEMSGFISKREDHSPSQPDGASPTDATPVAPAAAPKGMTWDDVCTHMSRDHGYTRDQDREIDHDMER